MPYPDFIFAKLRRDFDIEHAGFFIRPSPDCPNYRASCNISRNTNPTTDHGTLRRQNRPISPVAKSRRVVELRARLRPARPNADRGLPTLGRCRRAKNAVPLVRQAAHTPNLARKTDSRRAYLSTQLLFGTHLF